MWRPLRTSGRLTSTSFLLYIIFLWVNFSKLLFTYILIVDYLLVIRGIASFVAVRLFQASSQGWISSFVCLLLYLLSLPVLLRFFRQVAGQVYRTQAPRLWRTVWLIPALFTILTLLSTNSYLEDSAESWFFLFCRISLLLCVFVIYYVLLQTLENLQKQIMMEQQMIFEKHLLEIQMEEQKKHSLLILENAKQTRQMRHDLRHQLTAIQAMVGNENPQLTAYISTLIHAIPSTVKAYCENPTVNAVVSHYAHICQRGGISFTAQLVVPAHNSHVSDSSLCVIFGNLLENAVEACGRMTEGKRYIRLSSVLEHGVLTITMDNSFDGKARLQDGVFYSHKRMNFSGIGLSSIRAVARAHQGDARFEAKGSVFLSSAYVKL